MTAVYDFYSRHGPEFLRELKAQGAAGIARYLTARPDDPRATSQQEVDDAHAAGLAMHFVYEMNPTYADYFSPDQGTTDATHALAFLDTLGAPEGTVVYFTVDANIDPTLTIPYFNAIDAVLGAHRGRALGGVYGFQRMIEFARENFGNLGKHLWQTYGTVSGPLDLWQHEQLKIAGVEVDLNDCSVSGWMAEGGQAVSKDDYLKVAADGLSLEDRVKQTIRVIYEAEIRPAVAAEIDQRVAAARPKKRRARPDG